MPLFILVCIQKYYSPCIPDYHTHTNDHFPLELSLMRIIWRWLTYSSEPNLVGSKLSCSTDAFQHAPNHFLKLVLYPKKKWHNYHFVLERVHASCWTLHIALKSRVTHVPLLVRIDLNSQYKVIFFLLSMQVFVFIVPIIKVSYPF